MSLVENLKLRNNTLNYINQTPIISFDMEQSSNDGGQYLKMKLGDEALWSVKGESRIVATDLLPAGNRVGVSVRTDNLDTAIAADWMPTYWLPWGRNRIIRTTLRRRSLTTRTGVAKVGITQIGVNNPNYAPDSNDPDFFITSAVNGCTVFIEGPEEQPTIYHGNAIGMKDEKGRGPMDLAVTGKGKAAQNLIEQKVMTMQDQFQRLSEGDAKATRGGGVFTPQPAKVITQSEYQMLVMEGRIGSGYELEAKQVTADIAGREGVRTKEVRLKKSQGTVFGLRTGGKWKFYYQKLVCYECFQDVAPKWKLAEWVKNPAKPTDYHVVAAGEFWPNGPGMAL